MKNFISFNFTRKLFSLLLLSVLFAALPLAAQTTVPYVIPGISDVQNAAGVTVITSAADLGNGTLTSGWYAFSGTFTYNGTITVSGDVNLILEDGCSVTVNGANAGIDVEGTNSLTIYAQTGVGSFGALTANGAAGGAGIGGKGVTGGVGSAGGTITINGGAINAYGGYGGAGIGGGGGTGGGGAGGMITINGGIIDAEGSSIPDSGGAGTGGAGGGAGIGGGGGMLTGPTTNTCFGGSGGTIIINGGAITAKGGIEVNNAGGAGIGGGGGTTGGNGGTIIITTIGANGSIAATGGNGKGGGAGIGGGGGMNSLAPGSAGGDSGSISIVDPSTPPISATGNGSGGGSNFSGANIGSGGCGNAAKATAYTNQYDPNNGLYTITVEPTANGSILAVPGGDKTSTVATTVSVLKNSNQTFYFTPATNYILSDVTVDGTSVGTPSSYTFKNVTTTHTISATFTTPPAPTPILSVATYVTDPVKGNTPNTTASDGANFTAGTVTWSPADSPFKANTVYTATVTLTASAGFTFLGLVDADATINDNAATTVSVSPDGNTVTLSYQFPATGPEAIEAVAIDITAPIKGDTPDGTATATGVVDFTAGPVTWSPTDSPFKANTVYTATVTLTANTGFTFTGLADADATINGNAATSVLVSSDGKTVQLSYQFPITGPEVIEAVAITVTAPATGDSPDGTADTGGADFTAGTVTWAPVEDPFKPITQYTATVTLTANTGFTFTGMVEADATINGFGATVSNNTGSTVTLSYEFPATEPIAIGTVATTVTVPVTGNSPDGTATYAANANFTAGTVAWTPGDDPFLTNKEYTATVTLTANTGYTFTGLTAATVNNQPATSFLVDNAGNTVTLTYKFPETVPIAVGTVATTITVPVTGNSPDGAATDGTNFTAGTVTWTPGDDPFFGSTIYTAEVTLTAKDGFTFTGLTAATVNNQPATSFLVDNTGNTVTLTYEFPATDPTAIVFAATTVTAPATGNTPNTTASDGANFTAGTVAWTPGDNPFLVNTKYTATVILTANHGYTFTGLATATINGNAASVTNNTGDEVTLSYEFTATAPIVIGTAAVTVTAPVKGNAPDGTASGGAGANFTAGAVAWSPVNNPFLASTEYTATVTLTANTGFTFTGLADANATINGNAATVTSNTGNQLTLSYKFPATASTPPSGDDDGHPAGRIAPEMSLTASPGATVSDDITLTAKVFGTESDPLATGKVTFMQGNVELGTADLNGSGVATFVCPSPFYAGSGYTYVAIYQGDVNYYTNTATATLDVPVSFYVSESSLNFIAAGETKPIIVISNTGWSISADATWAMITTANDGSHSMFVTAKPNPVAAQRSMIFTFKAGTIEKTLRATQDGLNAMAIRTADVSSLIVYSQNGNAIVKSDAPVQRVEVYDVSGKLLKQVKGGSNLITISGLPSRQMVIVKVTDNELRVTSYKLQIEN